MGTIGLIPLLVPLIAGWILDLLLGDPSGLPHPVIGFGKIISWGEKRWNQGRQRCGKGTLFAVTLILCTFGFTFLLIKASKTLHPALGILLCTILVFYCLAGNSLIREVKAVFEAVDRSTEEGRKQVARIVGRDTSQLSPLQIRTAALETLAENLSDGVVAPLFWYMLLGVPGMLTYKMINTLDSMIGYKNQRYKAFGRTAARIDDAANYIPARLTAILMVLVHGRLSLIQFVRQYGHKHASPNSGYPEAALAGILDARFGGPNYYFGELVEKPYIGEHSRIFTIQDLSLAITINRRTEAIMVILAAACCSVISLIP